VKANTSIISKAHEKKKKEKNMLGITTSRGRPPQNRIIKERGKKVQKGNKKKIREWRKKGRHSF